MTSRALGLRLAAARGAGMVERADGFMVDHLAGTITDLPARLGG